MSRSDLEAIIAPMLRKLYPQEHDEVCGQLIQLVEAYAQRMHGRSVPARDHATTYLITYGDAVRRPGETPLHTLDAVLREQVGDVVSDVHLLPMFPWTSDDGFAIVDYRQVNPDLGTWDDVESLASAHSVMFDFVANHISSSSPWFTRWLAGDPRYEGYFIEADPEFDISRVVRPRTSPLFHQYARPDGRPVSVWTTFGPDQIDVNVATPAALLDLTDVLLGYVEHGASTIRLDAIGFLWKESGTPCIHHPNTHVVIKLWRAVVEHVAPGTQLITETNVPDVENISYFGDGHDEASMVYQFGLPPLVLHAFVSGQTKTLSSWASDVGPVSTTATWFNFLASHDGIGLRPTEGILSDEERQLLVDRTLAHGGRVSMAARPDGSSSVYELNISYIDALATPSELEAGLVVADKALAAHSILLSMIGVPAIYYHSLFGSRPDREGMQASGINRRINREVLDADRLIHELRHEPRRATIFEGLRTMLDVRRKHQAFSPYGSQRVETYDTRALVVRRAPDTPDELICVTSVTDQPVTLPQISGVDVISGQQHEMLRLPAYGYAWVRPVDSTLSR